MKLLLPITLKLATEDDVPKTAIILQRLKQAQSAKIEEGYSLIDVKDEAYSFYSEVNINNDKLWDLVEVLMKLLPDTIALLIGLEDSEINYGKYTDKKELLEQLIHYRTELCEDVFIEWGLIYNDDEKLIEILVSSSKYLKVWGTNKDKFTKILSDFDLQYLSDIEFIDDYPKVRYPLSIIKENTVTSTELIKTLIN